MPPAVVCHLALLTLALALQPAMAAETRRVTFCAEDENSYPWLLKDRPGMNIHMLKMVEAQLGIRIDVDLQPWKRCLKSMQDGRVDGAFKASFSPERLEFGLFPMLEDKPDIARRMLTESYHLYRLKGGTPSWDGKQIQNSNGLVGAQTGFSIVEQLRAMKLEVDDGSRVPENIFKKLMLGRIGIAALQTNPADYTLANDAQMLAKIERMEPPLATKHYYLMLSRQFVARDAALAENIWSSVAAVRESPAYRQALATFK